VWFREEVPLSTGRQPSLFDWDAQPEKWELEAEEDCLVAQVAFNRPLQPVFDYLVPPGLRELIEPGQRVQVPFGRGNQLTMGYCVGLTPGMAGPRKLKEVREILDRRPLLSPGMLDLTRWMSERYLCSWGQVLESVIPAGVKKQAGTREILHFEPVPGLELESLKLPRKQREVLKVLLECSEPLTLLELSERAGCGSSPIEALRRAGWIVPLRIRSQVAEAGSVPVETQADLKLNAEQQVAQEAILEALRGQRHETFLLHGVTGSGKTEIYIQAIREVVSYGRQAIVLVPEISLTPQTIRRFRARFPSVAVLHSHLSDADRHWHWQQIAEGKVQVVVGARSAIFAPVPQLGLIVIDEEHEATFKQQTIPRYHAREVARERARRERVPLLLGSATPTLESLLQAQQGTDRLLKLTQRVESRPLPRVTLVDTRNDPLLPKGHSIGRALGQAMTTALKDQGQVILFLNLRGYAPVMWCPACQGVRCPDCDVTLTWHRDKSLLLCHSCEFQMPVPERCPQCGQPGLRFLGAGTQRLESEIRSRFPDARVLRMDSDSMKAPGSHDVALEAFRHGKYDILLGTQMIAKGLDFPNITLVGVIDADTLLHQPELRSAERTFQLISQVAGRTGRGHREGRVLVQTMSPMEPVIQCAARHDYDGFAQLELGHRRALHSPPYSSMVRVIVRSLDDALAQKEARRVADLLREQAQTLTPPVKILGPAPAMITRLRKFYRYHLQLTCERLETLQALWGAVSPQLGKTADVELTVDVDPLDMR